MNIIIYNIELYKNYSCTQFICLLCFRRFQHFFVSRSSKAATHVSIEAAAEQQQSNSRATAEQQQSSIFLYRKAAEQQRMYRENCVYRENCFFCFGFIHYNLRL